MQEKLGCARFAAEDNPSIGEFDVVIIVAPNSGDEELAQPMEDYLFGLDHRGKKYFVCELGNYFGLDDYCGCKRVVFQILDRLGWRKISDISLDSMPELDVDGLNLWIDYALLNDDQ